MYLFSKGRHPGPCHLRLRGSGQDSAPEAVFPFSLEFTLSLPRAQTACYFQSPWVLQKLEPLLLCLLKFNFFLFPLWHNTRWLGDKELAWNAGDLGSIPGLGKSPGGGHGNPPQYFHLKNPTDRGASGATVRGVTKSGTRLKQQSTQAGMRTSHKVARFNHFKRAVQWDFVHLFLHNHPHLPSPELSHHRKLQLCPHK